MKREAFVLGAVALATAPRAISAQSLTVTAALSRLFASADPQAAWFSATFIAAVPLAKIRSINQDIVNALGAFRSVAPNGDGYALTFAQGSLQANAAVDTTGAFTSLYVHGMQSGPIATRLGALFTTDPVPAAWFADSMLAKAPIDQIRSGLKELQTQFGAFTNVVPRSDGSYDITFAKGTINSTMSFGGDGTINGLTFEPATPPKP
jgi:hypothetical protein